MGFGREIDRRVVPALKHHPAVLGEGGEGLFAGGVADMDFECPPPVIAAVKARAEHGLFGYEAVPSGLYPALIDWLEARHGWRVAREQILRAPNILNPLAIAASLFAGPGEGVITQPPVFFDFYDILRENDREIILNPLILKDGRYEMDFDDLEAKAADPRARAIYLCNPHNPVGRVWTADELRRLGEICAAHGVLVVSDEIHGDIVFNGRRHTPFMSLGEDFAQNAIALVSPAKSFNIASCCSAFTVIADEARRTAFQAENSRLTVNKNNAFANVAMEAAYREGGPWLDACLDYLEGNLELILERIAETPGVAAVAPEGTFLIWLDFRETGLEGKALTRFLRERAGWAVTRGEAFGEGGAGFQRLNFACPRPRLAAALDRLGDALSS